MEIGLQREMFCIDLFFILRQGVRKYCIVVFGKKMVRVN